MFRRLINNNIKTIGVRRFTHCSNNDKIVEELQKVNRSLNYMYGSLFTINITLCVIALKK
jgi:hypothetical protein